MSTQLLCELNTQGLRAIFNNFFPVSAKEIDQQTIEYKGFSLRFEQLEGDTLLLSDSEIPEYHMVFKRTGAGTVVLDSVQKIKQ